MTPPFCSLSTIVLIVAACSVHVTGLSQSGWTTPVALLPGPDNDVHPAIADGHGFMFNAEEMLAFSRNGKNICLVRTTDNGNAWNENVLFITTDSADNDYPSVVHALGIQPHQETAMLVWHGSRDNNLEILYSRLADGQWSAPSRITYHPDNDIHPKVTQAGNVYYCVWERRGTILFSEYVSDSWSLPVTISAVNDTNNHKPQVPLSYTGQQPLVVWERHKDSARTSAVMYTARSGAAWRTPDTLVFTGDNRRPKFYKYMNYAMHWDRYESGNSTCMSGYLNWNSGVLRLTSVSPLLYTPVFQRHASVNGYAIITSQYHVPTFAYFAAAAWEATDSSTDSIGVSVLWQQPPFTKVSAGGNTRSLNPDVSQGTYAGDGRVRIWAVWEAARSDRTKLFATSGFYIVGAAGEELSVPARFGLYQNYPNPFNPNTTIKFQIPHSNHVTLKIFDVLGREVATPVDEAKEAGKHAVIWDASAVASGVYLCRMTSAGFVQTRKLILTR